MLSATTFRKAGLLALIFFGILSGALAQQKAVIIMGDLTVYAWSMEKAENRIIAAGDVELHYKNIKLSSDRIEMNTETRDVLATGHVSLQMPDEVVDCENISFNLDTAQGKFEKALGRIKPSVLYEAAAIERKAENLYSLQKAYFTSCTQPTPRWKFSFSRANLKKDDYMEMWGAVFSIKKVPVFYWPYMRYPLNQDRATGFLMPQIGYSQVKGFSMSQDFYWAIARNMDATFSLDYYSAKGLGGGSEYRYVFRGGTGGEAHFYYFAFKPVPGQVKQENAYIIRWNHNQPLPWGFGLVANVDYQSSFNFLREFDNNFYRALVFNRISQVYLSKSWASFNFSMRASRFETSSPLFNSSIVYQYLPQINFDSFKVKVLPSLYFSFSSSFTRWQYGWDYQYKKNTQAKSQNFSLSPALSLPFNAIPWLTVDVSLEGRLNFYWQSIKPRIGIVDEPLLTKNYVVNVDLVGPVFYRIWELRSGSEGTLTRLKHIIEPVASYHYESPIADIGKIITPLSLYRYHFITYGLTNHVLLKKGEGQAREMFTFGLQQAFFVSAEDSPLSNFRINGKIPQFGDISNYVRFYPGAKFSLDLSATFNTYQAGFSGIRLGANVASPADPLFLSVNWFKSTNLWYRDPWGDRHQISAMGGVKMPVLPLEMRGEIDFNITEGRMLFSAVSAIYHYQCLDLKADLRIFYFREKPELQFKISFGLGNIGKTTDFLGGARFD